MLGLGLWNVLYYVMLPMGLICALYFLSVFSKLFQIIRVNISVGMPLAYVRGVGSSVEGVCQPHVVNAVIEACREIRI
jgi:hypothetical protein